MRPSLGASEPDHQARDGRLAATRFADQRQGFAVAHFERHAVYPRAAAACPRLRALRSSQGRETSKSRETALALSNGARMQPAGGLAHFSRHQLGPRAQAALEALGAARVNGQAARDRVEARHSRLDLREARAPRACRDAAEWKPSAPAV